MFFQPPEVMTPKCLMRHVVPPVSVSQNGRSHSARVSAGVAWLAATWLASVAWLAAIVLLEVAPHVVSSSSNAAGKLPFTSKRAPLPKLVSFVR